jgi:hypothetical protein
MSEFVSPVVAYVDPGTGSFLLQMVLAGALGAVFTVKAYWARLRGLLLRRSTHPRQETGA